VDPVSEPIDPRIRELLTGPNYAHVATIGRDGAPRTTAVWIHHEGDLVVIYKEASTVALANLRRDPRLSISVIAFDNPYLGCTIRGRAVEFEGEPAARNWLSARSFEYTGEDMPAQGSPTEGVLIKIEVDHQTWHHFEQTHRGDTGNYA
jgi:PPOX class probable F420-dependent enzyme